MTFRYTDSVRICIPWNYPGTNESDPNTSYRHWLETHVGIQSEDWAWNIGINNNTIDLYILNDHIEVATIIALKWACKSE